MFPPLLLSSDLQKSVAYLMDYGFAVRMTFSEPNPYPYFRGNAADLGLILKDFGPLCAEQTTENKPNFAPIAQFHHPHF